MGSEIADQRPTQERPRTVLLRHTDTYAGCLFRVVSSPLEKACLESVSKSVSGGRTDVQQIRVIAMVMITVHLGSGQAV